MVSMQGLGYKEILDYLDGKNSLEEAVTILKNNLYFSAVLAKRFSLQFQNVLSFKYYFTLCRRMDL